jgi:hypothetical protein
MQGKSPRRGGDKKTGGVKGKRTIQEVFFLSTPPALADVMHRLSITEERVYQTASQTQGKTPRRHLTDAQRSMIAASIANLSQWSNQYEEKVVRPIGLTTEPTIPQAKAAEMMHGGDRGNQYTGGKGPIGPLPESFISNTKAARISISKK